MKFCFRPSGTSTWPPVDIESLKNPQNFYPVLDKLLSHIFLWISLVDNASYISEFIAAENNVLCDIIGRGLL